MGGGGIWFLFLEAIYTKSEVQSRHQAGKWLLVSDHYQTINKLIALTGMCGTPLIGYGLNGKIYLSLFNRDSSH